MHQTALIITCPAAEPAVAAPRHALDQAAQAGVPAHVTVLFPFNPAPTNDDHAALAHLIASHPTFTLLGEDTAWFGDHVVYVPPTDPRPVKALTAAVEAALPAYRIYGGAFAEVVPHLTIGAGHPVQELRAAEEHVRTKLPFAQVVDQVELWTGPALDTAPQGSWRCVQRYPLGQGSGTG